MVVSKYFACVLSLVHPPLCSYLFIYIWYAIICQYIKSQAIPWSRFISIFPVGSWIILSSLNNLFSDLNRWSLLWIQLWWTKKLLEGGGMQHLLHCQKEKSNIFWLFYSSFLINIISNQGFLCGILQSHLFLLWQLVSLQLETRICKHILTRQQKTWDVAKCWNQMMFITPLIEELLLCLQNNVSIVLVLWLTYRQGEWHYQSIYYLLVEFVFLFSGSNVNTNRSYHLFFPHPSGSSWPPLEMCAPTLEATGRLVSSPHSSA